MRVSAVAPFVVALFLTCALDAGQPAKRGRSRRSCRQFRRRAAGGVTVTATAGDGRVLATAVTDGSGRYVFPALPPKRRSHVSTEGFAEVRTALEVKAGAESRGSTPGTGVAFRDRCRSRPAPTIVLERGSRQCAPPPLAANPVPAHDRSAVCGPAKADVVRSVRSVRSSPAVTKPRESCA
jgi:hypothetical protein